MKSFLSKVEKASEWLVGTCIFIIVVVLSLQVFCRYVLVRPLIWPEELAKFAFIWSVFFGAFVGIRKKMHVVIDIVPNMFSARFKVFNALFINMLIICILVTGAYYGLALYRFSLTSKLPAINIPLGYIYLPLAISFSLMILSHIDMSLDVWKAYRGSSK